MLCSLADYRLVKQIVNLITCRQGTSWTLYIFLHSIDFLKNVRSYCTCVYVNFLILFISFAIYMLNRLAVPVSNAGSE